MPKAGYPARSPPRGARPVRHMAADSPRAEPNQTEAAAASPKHPHTNIHAIHPNNTAVLHSPPSGDATVNFILCQPTSETL